MTKFFCERFHVVCKEFEALLDDESPLETFTGWLTSLVERCVVVVSYLILLSSLVEQCVEVVSYLTLLLSLVERCVVVVSYLTLLSSLVERCVMYSLTDVIKLEQCVALVSYLFDM